MDKKEIFTSGLRKSMPIALGYFPVAFTFGIMATAGGVDPITALIISLTNFTSAGQFAGTQIMIVGGPLVEIAITTFIINIRYMLMSLAISQKLEPTKLWERLVLAFGITDESFALVTLEKKKIPFLHMLGIILGPYIGWALGTFCGAYASSLLPQNLQQSMGIALYALFIALIIPGMKKAKAVCIVVIVSIGISLAFHYMPFIRDFTSGWKIITITLIGSSIGAWLFPINEEDFT